MDVTDPASELIKLTEPDAGVTSARGKARERVRRHRSRPPRSNSSARMRAYGASQDELTFISGGARVELNAMPSDQFIDWIEQGLIGNGVRKVVPSPETIEAHARQLLGLRHLRKHVAELEQAARQHAADAALPADLAELIRREFKRDPVQPWEDALSAVLAGMTAYD